jgi:RNA polymerase sigma-70 factor, ECF subfamily
MDNSELRQDIARAQAGQAEAFENLLTAYGNRLYGFFYRAVGNHHEAEDLLSEMSLRLVRQLPKYRHQGRFEPWLFRIAANLVRDRIRRRKARPGAMSLAAGSDDGSSLGDDLPADSPSVDVGLMGAERSETLQRALAELDETTRQMILLRHFGEMSFKDIADLCGCPLGTALARVHRGLKALRTSLESSVTEP